MLPKWPKAQIETPVPSRLVVETGDRASRFVKHATSDLWVASLLRPAAHSGFDCLPNRISEVVVGRHTHVRVKALKASDVVGIVCRSRPLADRYDTVRINFDQMIHDVIITLRDSIQHSAK